MKRIIIFGSSVTSACNPWSDIDVFVELDKDARLEKPQTGVPIDLWTNYDVDDRLMQERGVLYMQDETLFSRAEGNFRYKVKNYGIFRR